MTVDAAGRPGWDEAIEVASSMAAWGKYGLSDALDAAYPIIAAAVLAEAERRIKEADPDNTGQSDIDDAFLACTRADANIVANLRAELSS